MSVRSFEKQNPLLAFILINYVISWSFLYPCYQAILNAEEGTFPWLALIGIPGGFGPSIAALIITGINKGKAGTRQLLRKFRSFKVNWKWYLFVILLPIGLYFLAVISTGLFGFELEQPLYVKACVWSWFIFCWHCHLVL